MSKSQMIANTEFLTYNPGEYIFSEGEAGKSMYSIIEGKVEIRANDTAISAQE